MLRVVQSAPADAGLSQAFRKTRFLKFLSIGTLFRICTSQEIDDIGQRFSKTFRRH
jgi:hypothetical protein